MIMRCLMRAAALSAALFTAQIWAQPAAAQDQGPPVEVTGILDLVIVDDFTQGRAQLGYFVREVASGRAFELNFARPPGEQWQTGDTVTVRGFASGRRISVTEMDAALGGDGATQGESQPDAGLAAGTESRAAIVMMVDLVDTRASSYYSLDQIASIMFTGTQSVDGLYRETSFGQISFPGDTDGDGQADVFGPFAINDYGNDCDYYAWAFAADDAATAAGIDLSLYQHRVYVLPPYYTLGCNWGGVANVGGPRSWIAMADQPVVFAHELGHNLRMRHAGDWGSTYGDYSDFMGSSLSWHRLNGAHMDQMGWLAPYADSLVNVFASGTYDLYPLKDDPALGGVRVLKIAKPDSSEFYYLSYRQRGGYDTTLQATYTQGVNIHRYRGSGSSATTFLFSLTDGGVFEDQTNGFSVTQIGRGPDNAYVTVAVDFGGCAIADPSASLSPAEQGLVPGGNSTHTFSLTNNDGAGCGGTTFDLALSLDPGLGGALSASQLTLAPGETGTASLQLSASLGGTYVARVDATDGDGVEPTHNGVYGAAATVTVDSTAPTAPTGLTASLSKNGDHVVLAWTASSDGDGSGIAFYRIFRDDGAGMVEVGQSNRTDYNDSAVAFETTYSYAVKAVDMASNESVESFPATVTTGKAKAKGIGGGIGGGKGGGKGGGPNQ